MRATFLIGALLLVAACAQQPVYEEPAPARASALTGTTTYRADPCNQSDFPAGPAGDAAYTNCLIER